MKVKVDGNPYEYNQEKYLKGVRAQFPLPGNWLRRYPHAEEEFTTPFIKLFTVPEGYAVVYKRGGAVQLPVYGAGWHLMVGLGGLWSSAHVIGIRPRSQDLVSEKILTKNKITLSQVDSQLFYEVKFPQNTLGVPDYRAVTFGAALARVVDYVGDHDLETILTAKNNQTNLLLDDKGIPISFPTVRNVGVNMLELRLVEIPLGEATQRILEQEAQGTAERVRREQNAKAEAYEIEARGEAIAKAGERIQNVPGGVFLRLMETYDEVAQGPNNFIFTMPEIKLDIRQFQERAEEKNQKSQEK